MRLCILAVAGERDSMTREMRRMLRLCSVRGNGHPCKVGDHWVPSGPEMPSQDQESLHIVPLPLRRRHTQARALSDPFADRNSSMAIQRWHLHSGAKSPQLEVRRFVLEYRDQATK